jgi:hypothetical protein
MVTFLPGIESNQVKLTNWHEISKGNTYLEAKMEFTSESEVTAVHDGGRGCRFMGVEHPAGKYRSIGT